MGGLDCRVAVSLALVSTGTSGAALVNDAHAGGLCGTNFGLFCLGNFLYGISKLFLCTLCGYSYLSRIGSKFGVTLSQNFLIMISVITVTYNNYDDHCRRNDDDPYREWT